ncbi:hypothetical protein [Floridanema evergladense]|uniref:Uncharacterized protein n=1 Tax=Floridaenema evergladense BLCC-F167 TaxID=3153639 RepID=A0ABV4WDP6_9CYAN
MIYQQSLSTQMPSFPRFDGGKTATWRAGMGIGVDCLLRGIYIFGERGISEDGDFISVANHQRNLKANLPRRSGRYRHRITVPA